MSIIDKEAFVHALDSMKKQSYDETIGLIVELKDIFQFQKLFTTTWIIYPQYWLVLVEVETTFLRHLAIIQAHFGHQKAMGTSSAFFGPFTKPYPFPLIIILLEIDNA
jgi:hypothetical protein